MRIKPLYAGGIRITRPDSATYVGELIIGDVWVGKTEQRRAAQLVQQGAHRLEILPRLYEPQLVSVLAVGILLRGLEDYRFEGERRIVLQEWRCELPDKSLPDHDRAWHPLLERRHRKMGMLA